MSIAENIKTVKKQIAQAAQRNGRKAEDITLIAVTKTHPAAVVDEAIRCGITDIGENRIQEAVEKYENVKKQAVWHLVGHLQRNKVKTALRIFDIIHSIDSLRLAVEINKRAAGTVDVFVEVNIGEEKSKSGIMPGETLSFLKELRVFPNLRCRGLMTIPPMIDDAEKLRHYFRDVAEIQAGANRMNIFDYPLTDLSMGMTDDYQIAIEEGATMVRIGRALFGERRNINQ
ncbi:hypothetical protein AMJ80_07385 [bacterium SM23_31]|nr:MAG: hypothetical protein AMJ80_07385 [bacterium SM23_31]